MTYYETAALGRSAANLENSSDSHDQHELRQWTIKNLDAAVVDKARAAAKKNGMKINAWVAAALENAADLQLEKTSPGGNALSRDIDTIVSKIEEARRADRILIERIERDVSQLMKGQHGMLAEILSSKIRGSDSQ